MWRGISGDHHGSSECGSEYQVIIMILVKVAVNILVFL